MQQRILTIATACLLSAPAWAMDEHDFGPPPPLMVAPTPAPVTVVPGQVVVPASVIFMPAPQVVIHQPPPPPPPPAYVGMAPHDFRQLKQAIRGEDIANGKIRVLKSALLPQGVMLSAAQVAEIIPMYEFEKWMLEALQLCVGKIADPQNNYRILGAFEFESHKKKAEKILGL